MMEASNRSSTSSMEDHHSGGLILALIARAWHWADVDLRSFSWFENEGDHGHELYEYVNGFTLWDAW